jgi:hypothetical protein
MEEGKGASMIHALIRGLARPLILAVVLLCSTAHADEPIKTESGRLQKLVAKLASSDYVLGEPALDARPYIEPEPALNAFRHLAATLFWGDVRDAARKAAELDYELFKFVDVRTEREYYVLREDLDRVKSLRGWGSYIVNPAARVEAVVEVPHPVADAQTPEIGGAVFEKAAARGFLLAGTHRLKADVPDLVDSIFHQVHMAWVGPAAQVAAWQIHGFASYKHSFPKGAHMVASTGDGAIVPELETLNAVCEDQGMVSYVFNEQPAESPVNKRINEGVPGVTFASLAARTNEQGRMSRSVGGSFVHVELESAVRFDESQRDTAAEVIAAAMTSTPERALRETMTATGEETLPTIAAGGDESGDVVLAVAEKPVIEAVETPAESLAAEEQKPTEPVAEVAQTPGSETVRAHRAKSPTP